MISELSALDHRQCCIRGLVVLSIGSAVFDGVTFVLVVVTTPRENDTICALLFVAVNAYSKVNQALTRTRS